MQAPWSLIVGLLVANLAATIYFGTQDQVAAVPPPAGARSNSDDLPAVINTRLKQSLYDRFVEAFNSEDYDGLYEMLGPVAKAQFSREQTIEQFEKLVKYFQGIDEGGFTHSELAKTQGSTRLYVLYYTVRFSEGSELGEKGTLSITLAVKGTDHEIYGIRLYAGQ